MTHPFAPADDAAALPPAGPGAPHIRRSWRALFDDPSHAEALARCWVSTPGCVGDPVVLAPRALEGASVQCRPGTTDAQVFDDTFVGLYHLPPVELPDDAVILDLGANVGYTAAHFAAMLPKARIVCVEMDGANAAAARRNLAPFGPRCEVIRAAVWDRDGQIVYGGTEEWGYRVASLTGDSPTPLGDARTTAPAITVASLLSRCGLDRIDYAKVDIEGAEAAVVTPDATWLARVRATKVEYHEPATRQSIEHALRAAGFSTRPDERHARCVIGVR